MKSMSRFERFLHRIADRYRNDGYTVVLEPPLRRLPKFLRNFRPDMVASRGDENVVVGIKSQGKKKVRDSLYQLAEAVHVRPDWRLDIVFYEEEEELPQYPRYPSPKSIRTAIQDANAIYEQGHTAAAMMLACSAFEAAAKRAIAKVEDRYAYKLPPNDLVKRLVFHGFLTEGELEVAHKAIIRRNQIVHGRLKRPVPEKMLNGICKFTGRLLDQREVEIA